jgi:hypothetical protein
MFQSAGADLLAQAVGLTLLERNFESALAAIPSGYDARTSEAQCISVPPADGREASHRT